ncbi:MULTISPECIES: alkaline phosphatase PhoX [unclassified Anabaena]|uniref:alkaline phosphatase PhoX n=1 Tax=unclassified Anabaena TaxID=2619674 RepID=UPI0039C620E0
MTFSRRKFFALAGTTAAGTLMASPLEALLARKAFGQRIGRGYGPLLPDPNGLLELPEGFKYRILARTGDLMSDGNPVPGAHDGMGAFQGPGNTTIVVCNHELSNNSGTQVQVPNRYDAICRGGTTTLIVGPNRKLIKQFASIGGTIRNCAGGETPWGSWITCEEDVTIPSASNGVTKLHGYNFEVPADATEPVDPVPLIDMGRFNHEAVAVDPATGYVYQTEDRGDSLFYRFIPNVPGQLAEGGKLQAMVILGKPFAVETYNRTTGASSGQFAVGQKWSVDWVDIPNPNPTTTDNVRVQGRNLGAARFARGEGIWYGNGEFYFCATSGGPVSRGQVWRYIPGDETIDLFVESQSINDLDMPDNICVAPTGDLILCEDGSGEQFLRGVSSNGELYNFGRNALNTSELCGACFSPDGRTMFVNIQSPGIIFAIWGPWNSKRG